MALTRPLIADAHADSLMWNRDLSQASEEGHVDLPRLIEAGVGLQCFTLVTRGFPFIGGFPVFAAYQGWPVKAMRGEWARALWQIEQLETFCAKSNGQAVLAKAAEGLEANWSARKLSAVLGIEGAHALEGRPERVAELKALGVRFMSLTHLGNNALGGSSFPFMGNRPLSGLGHQVLDAMIGSRMAVDLAHASQRTTTDILSNPKARIFCSHTGVRGASDNWRNLSDEVLKAIADRGGVAGIIFGTIYLGGETLEDVARHIEHALNVMGEESVSFGSDFDGMVPLPESMRDVRDVPKLWDVLAGRGHSQRRLERIFGENLLRFFSTP